jgi:hypothetical protein
VRRISSVRTRNAPREQVEIKNQGPVSLSSAARAGSLAIVVALVVACGGEPPPGSADPRTLAVEAAERLTTIHGPWTVGEVVVGRYADLFRGSTNGPWAGPDAQRTADRIVWRIDLAGPDGTEELYIDAASTELVDAITQGQ